MRKNVTKIVSIEDEDLLVEMKFMAERMKMIVEPGSCLPMAGARKLAASGDIKPNERIGLIISAGNLEMSKFFELVLPSD